MLGLRATEVNAQPKVFARALLTKFRDPPAGFAFDAYALSAAARAGEEAVIRQPITRELMIRYDMRINS